MITEIWMTSHKRHQIWMWSAAIPFLHIFEWRSSRAVLSPSPYTALLELPLSLPRQLTADDVKKIHWKYNNPNLHVFPMYFNVIMSYYQIISRQQDLMEKKTWCTWVPSWINEIYLIFTPLPTHHCTRFKPARLVILV